MTVEKFVGIEVPKRVSYLRVIIMEWLVWQIILYVIRLWVLIQEHLQDSFI